MMGFNMFMNKLNFFQELSHFLGTTSADKRGQVVWDPELPAFHKLVYVEGVEAVALHHVIGQLVDMKEGYLTGSPFPS